MERHEFLAALHAGLRPRNYLEIGVDTGLSLELSRVPSIGIDPKFQVRTEIRTDVALVRATSDRFFARKDPLKYVRGTRNPWRNLRHGRPLLGRLVGRPTVDFAFIDGMHLFEYVLRDFMNVERFSSPTTVIVFDDMLPRNVPEASRERITKDWTGDVYKLIGVLDQYRPDLLAILVDTQPTGMLVIMAPDHASTVLKDHYEEIVAANDVPDPQPVPARVLERVDAVAPEAFFASDVCLSIVRSRRMHLPASRVRGVLERKLAIQLADVERRPAPSEGTQP